jgi:hypothetical protein
LARRNAAGQSSHSEIQKAKETEEEKGEEEEEEEQTESLRSAQRIVKQSEKEREEEEDELISCSRACTEIEESARNPHRLPRSVGISHNALILLHG